MFSSSRVYTYTADQLLAVRGSAPVRPSRSVRKSIFKYHLWLPARDRFTTTDSTSYVINESAVRALDVNSDVSKSRGWNNNNKITVGYLNARSIRGIYLLHSVIFRLRTTWTFLQLSKLGASRRMMSTSSV